MLSETNMAAIRQNQKLINKTKKSRSRSKPFDHERFEKYAVKKQQNLEKIRKEVNREVKRSIDLTPKTNKKSVNILGLRSKSPSVEQKPYLKTPERKI